MKTRVILLSAIFLGLFVFYVSGVRAQTILMSYCSTTYKETGTCPAKICRPVGKDSKKECFPADCTAITASACPLEVCALMEDCSGEKICHYQMIGEPPACGDLAYAGQDVECCKGFVKRCGIEFFNGTCDMEGKDSVYNLAICIPCGDTVCGQFENPCNCPEDCGEPRTSAP